MARSGQDRTASDHEGQEKKTHFTMVPNTVARDWTLSDGAIRLDVLIRSRAGKRGFCWLTYRTIRMTLRFGRSKIARCLRELEDGGYEKIIRRGGVRASQYFPLWPVQSRIGTASGPNSGLLAVPPAGPKEESSEEDSHEEEESTCRFPRRVLLSATERRKLSDALLATGLVSNAAGEQNRRFGQVSALYRRWRDAGGSLDRFVVAKMEQTTREVRSYLVTADNPWSYWLKWLRKLVENDRYHRVAPAPAAAGDPPASAPVPTLAPTKPADVAPTPDDPEPFSEGDSEDDGDADSNPDNWPAEDVEPGASTAEPTDRESLSTLRLTRKPPAGPVLCQTSELDVLAGALRTCGYLWPVARAEHMRERTAARRIIEGGWTMREVVAMADDLVGEGYPEVTFQEILWRLSEQQQSSAAAPEAAPSNVDGGPLAPSPTSIDNAAASAIDNETGRTKAPSLNHAVQPSTSKHCRRAEASPNAPATPAPPSTRTPTPTDWPAAVPHPSETKIPAESTSPTSPRSGGALPTDEGDRSSRPDSAPGLESDLARTWPVLRAALGKVGYFASKHDPQAEWGSYRRLRLANRTDAEITAAMGQLPLWNRSLRAAERVLGGPGRAHPEP